MVELHHSQALPYKFQLQRLDLSRMIPNQARAILAWVLSSWDWLSIN